MRLAFAAAVSVFLFVGCVHDGPSSDERLDQDTRGVKVEKEIRRSDLMKLKCGGTKAELLKARSPSRPEAERVKLYMSLYESLKDKRQTFETAMERNPDLAYEAGNEPLVAAKNRCISATADVKLELETYIRDIARYPTVQVVKHGVASKVARLDFNVVRQAIVLLGLDDKSALFAKLEAAKREIAKSTPHPLRHRRHR